jgi:hypothetical protein
MTQQNQIIDSVTKFILELIGVGLCYFALKAIKWVLIGAIAVQFIRLVVIYTI